MKYHLRPAFSTIELIIGFMISSILLTTTLALYNQISKSCSQIQNITSQDLATLIVQQRITNDLLGLIPLWFTKNDIKKTQQKNNPPSNQIKQNNYFYAQTNNEQLDFMTFVSTNTLHVYPQPQHYIARIVYTLRQDPDNQDFFILQRKEDTNISDEFNVQKIKEGNFYTVIKNIKKFKVEYGFIQTPDKVKDKNPEQAWKFTWVKQWPEKEEPDKKETEQKIPKLPDILKISVTLQELIYKPEVEHTFYCLIPESKNISLKSLAKTRIQKEIQMQQQNMSNAGGIINRVNSVANTAKGLPNAQ